METAANGEAMAPALLAPPGPRSMQRARGRAVAEFHDAGGRTRLARLHQAGCLKMRFPARTGPGVEAILINSSGGLTGGDRLAQAFTLGSGGDLTVTTQACERIYRSAGGDATVGTTVTVAENAAFAFLPQETILFDAGAVVRDLRVECRSSSRLLLAETVVLGRRLMGETVRSCRFRERWRLWRDGRLVFADDLRLEGDVGDRIAGRAALNGATAFSTILCQDPWGEANLEALRVLIGPCGGASAFDGLVLVRMVENSGFALRKRLLPVLSALAGRPLPRVWSI